LPEAVWASEGLAINAHLPAKFLLSRAVRDAGYKVILTGEGADEVFAGYAHLRADAGGALAQLAEANPVSAGIMLPRGESHSVEGRLPFRDHQLVEFVRDLPLGLKIRGGVEKYVLREAARPVLLETIYRRRKHPFLAPPLTASAAPAVTEFVHDLLREPRAA